MPSRWEQYCQLFHCLLCYRIQKPWMEYIYCLDSFLYNSIYKLLLRVETIQRNVHEIVFQQRLRYRKKANNKHQIAIHQPHHCSHCSGRPLSIEVFLQFVYRMDLPNRKIREDPRKNQVRFDGQSLTLKSSTQHLQANRGQYFQDQYIKCPFASGNCSQLQVSRVG